MPFKFDSNGSIVTQGDGDRKLPVFIQKMQSASIDAADLQRRRELIDQAAKDSMLRQMVSRKSAGATEQAADTRPVVTLRELAMRLKMDQSACRRYVLGLGYRPLKQRTADTGYQVALTFTAQEADEIYAKRSAEGYC